MIFKTIAMKSDKRGNASNEKIKEFEKHIDSLDDNIKYSTGRIDILVISLSSGGIALSMQFVKDILEVPVSLNYLLLRISWVVFAVAIVSNLLSQYTSYIANRKERAISRNKVRELKNKPIKGDPIRLECQHGRYNSWTGYLNIISILAVITAIIFMIGFMGTNF